MNRSVLISGIALLATGGSALAASSVVAHYRMGELELAGGTAIGGTPANLLPTTGSVNLAASGTPILQDATPPASARGGSTHFMRFDGVTQRFEATPSLLGSSTTGEWMIEAWVRPQAGGSGLGLIVAHGHGGAGQLLHYDAAADRYGWFVGGVGQFNGSVGATEVGTAWDHLALVRTAGSTRLYVNGILAGSNGSLGTSPFANGSAIGSQFSGGGTHGFTGDVDEVYYSTISGLFDPAADLHMSNAVDPIIAVPTGPFPAGTVAVATTGAAWVDIGNSGAANTLTISAVSPLSGDTGKFTLVTPLPLHILPGESGSLEFTYAPGGTAANHSATFTLANNDENRPSPTVTLTGEAITDPNLLVPATLVFGSVASNATTPKIVRVSNNAFNQDLNISLAITGTDAAKFSIVNPNPPLTAVAPAFGEDIEIACTPGGALGELNATLEITHNDPDLASPVLVSLTANSMPRYSEVAHYRLGESDADLATTLDDTGDSDLSNINGSPGTSYNLGSGAPGSSKGIDNSLDDVYSFTGIPAALAGRTQNWGMEAWIRPELATGSTQIGGGYGGLYLGVGNGARGGFGIFSIDGSHWGLNIGGVAAPNSVAPIHGGAWTHVAAVALDNQIRLYVNGILAHTHSGLGFAPDNNAGNVARIELGGQVATSWRTAGGLDEARIFSFVSGQFNPSTDLHVTPPADADGDGMQDTWEDEFFGNNDGAPTWAELVVKDGTSDTDGDDFTDKQEHDAGTDPVDPEDFPATEVLTINGIVRSGNTVTVNFSGVDGGTYVLKKSLTLNDGFPTTCGTVTLSGANSGVMTDTAATEAKAFYRVERP